MSRNITLLDAEFQTSLLKAVGKALDRGFRYTCYFTLRDPFTQCRFWRRSRSTAEVLEKIDELKMRNCDFLAHCLESVGPQRMDRWATNAIGGLSWHQYGLAADLYHNVDGKANWSPDGYEVLAEECNKVGLHTGLKWGDAGHVQAHEESPHQVFTLDEIDSMMKNKFGENDDGMAD